MTIERLKTLLVAAFVALAGCNTTGQQFTSLAPLTDRKGDVYLYRTNALYASGSIFPVFVDGVEVGGLLNGSYLVLRLPPGAHRLRVSPPGITFLSEKELNVEAGRAVFYEFAFQTGLLANALYLGSDIEPREQPQAIAALKELRAAVPGIVEPVAPYAALDNVDAVPYMGANGKSAYREWLTRAYPRAFVISASGKYAWAWGKPQKADEEADPTERALARCRKDAGDCRVYAIDGRVVWKPTDAEKRSAPTPAR